mmetsp:Transcript_8620/g.36476  ORF Transcript_8620/g.36476 Transcript_8620/m.36476 type:complete len:292 (-) Transcript_8620:1216-2091(-)
MYSFPVFTAETYTTHAGRARNNTLPGCTYNVPPPRTLRKAHPSAPPPCGASVAALAKKPLAIARRTGSGSFAGAIERDGFKPNLETCLLSCSRMSDARTSARRDNMFFSANARDLPPPSTPPARSHAARTLRNVTASPSATAKRSRASSSAFCLPRADCHTLVTCVNAATVSISDTHPMSSLTSRAFPSCGSRGSSARRTPSGDVNLASSSSAPSAYRSSIALSMFAAGGGLSHSKCTMLSMPRCLSCSTSEARSDRNISGVSCSGKRPKSSSVQSRKHLPGLKRPARPAR